MNDAARFDWSDLLTATGGNSRGSQSPRIARNATFRKYDSIPMPALPLRRARRRPMSDSRQ